MSDSATVFAAIAADGLEVVLYLWPVSVAMLVLGVGALVASWRLRDQKLQERVLLFAIPYGIPVLILLIGTLLRYDGPPHPNWREPPAWRGWVLVVPLVLSLLLLVRAVVVMKGARLRSVAALLPALWLAVCAYIPSGFAVAGVGP